MKAQRDVVFLDYNGRKNKTAAEVVKDFDIGAGLYDELLSAKDYKAPLYTAELVADFFGSEKAGSVKILDVAAGTGLVAEELTKKGFRNIDGLDPSPGMRDEALKKGIYTTYFLEYLNGHRIEGINTDTYDCVTLAGGLNIGLVPCIGFLEMIRVTKPGGLICFASVPSLFENIEEYKNRLEPLLSWLEEDDLWNLIAKKPIADYASISLTSGCTSSESDDRNAFSAGCIHSYVVKASDVATAKYEQKLYDLK